MTSRTTSVASVAIDARTSAVPGCVLSAVCSTVFCVEVVCVERFVDDLRIAALCESIHECSGDVPGSRPEANPFCLHVSLGFLLYKVYSYQYSVLSC